jgi:alkylation response protein AidB-like acyl-CoA dehydrogenase
MDSWLQRVWTAAPANAETLAEWWAATASARAAWPSTIERAVVGGALADRIGFAFAGGYAEALRALVPDLRGITALCATEQGGNHPRAIQTTFTRGVLNGRKTWATAATAASSLLVVASVGRHDGKNQLRVVRVATDAPGVRMHATSAAFVPEIPHAEVVSTMSPSARSTCCPAMATTTT